MAIQKKFGNRLMDLPLGEHDFTLEAIAQQQGIAYELVSRKANKLNTSLKREEVALQKAEVLVDGVLEKLKAHPLLAKDKVEELQAALAHRQENEQYLKDLHPKIKDASKQLLTPYTTEDATALMAVTSSHEQDKLLLDKDLTAKAQRAVDQRFGGYCKDDAGERIRALTSDGMEQLLVRYPYKEKSTPKPSTKEPEVSVAYAASAHVQDAIRRISTDLPSEAVPTFSETPQREEIKPTTRIGNISRGSNGTVVHRGHYGRD
jgi:hypothetical protein